MKVALIQPTKDSCQTIPFTIGYLASYLEKYNIEVMLIDEAAHDSVEEILMYYHPEIIGITCTTLIAPRAYSIIKWIKKNTNAYLIMGGVHASALPEEVFALGVDCVVAGEGEKALLQIIKDPNKYYKQVVIDPLEIENLDELPSPAFHKMHIESYYVHARQLFPKSLWRFAPRGARVGSILSSRGCPYRCIFCVNSIRSYQARSNSIDRMLAEIEYFVSQHKAQYFFFPEDDFFCNKTRFLLFAEELKKYFPKIKYYAQAGAKFLDDEILLAAKRSGCVQVGIGFESGSERILNYLKRGFVTVEDNKRAVELCRKHKMKLFGNFIIGAPNEERSDLELTRKFIFENKIDDAAVSMLMPFPGTELWHQCLKKGIISKSENNWERWNLYSHNFSICRAVGEAELAQFIGAINKHFYYRNCDMNIKYKLFKEKCVDSLRKFTPKLVKKIYREVSGSGKQ